MPKALPKRGQATLRQKSSATPATRWPVVSVFTGAGGLDLGLEQAGDGRFEFRAWIESDLDARATLTANRPEMQGHPAFFEDIRLVDPNLLMRQTHLEPGETFLLAGGPPCQAFSTAGLRQAVSDANGNVIHNYFQLVGTLKPRFFLFENVRGLLSAALKHRPLTQRSHPQEVPVDEDARLGSVMQRVILPTFHRLGYEVIFGLLNAADYGTAQVRQRVFVLGSRDREFRSGTFRKQTGRAMTPLDLVPATHHRLAPYPPIRPWRTLEDSLGNLRGKPVPLAETYTYSLERASIFMQIPPGRNWTYVRDNPQLFPSHFLERIMGNAIYSGGGKEGYWRRLRWGLPAPTLTAQPQQLATSLCHPDDPRPLSIPEYALLQDFPKTYVFQGSKSSCYRQIGNAVPVKLATAIGKSIIAVATARDPGQSAEQELPFDMAS